jgi:hypothetical protein
LLRSSLKIVPLWSCARCCEIIPLKMCIQRTPQRTRITLPLAFSLSYCLAHPLRSPRLTLAVFNLRLLMRTCVHASSLPRLQRRRQVYAGYFTAKKCTRAHFSAHTAFAWTRVITSSTYISICYKFYKFYYDLTRSEISKKFSRDVPPVLCAKKIFLRRRCICLLFNQ